MQDRHASHPTSAGGALRTAFSTPPRVVDLRSRTLEEALAETAATLGRHAAVKDPTRFTNDLLARSAQGCVRLADGITLAHVRTPAVADFVIAAGFSTAGLANEHDRGTPVRVLVLLGSPNGRPTQHLALLAELARRLSAPGIAEILHTPNPAAQLAQVLLPPP